MPRSFLPLSFALATIAVVGWRADRRGAEPRVVAETRFDYVADEGDGRVVAEVRVAVLAAGHGAARRYELVVEPSATGARVAPIPGFRGVHGVNLQTARDLERLVAGGDIEIVTVPRGEPTAERRGSIGEPVHAHLRERRLLAEGGIDHAARTTGALPSALTMHSGPLPAGAWHTEVRADGRARLAVDFVAGHGGARIDSIRALAAHDQETRP